MTDQRDGFLGAVGRFFFSPTDPTVLGFMRIMAGLLLLYTHAVYSLDLKELLGPNAWWDQQQGNYQRRTAPYVPTPMGWELQQPTLRVDDVQHRREAEIEFMRSLPYDPAARRPKLRYLQTLIARTNRNDQANYQDYVSGIVLVNSASRVLTDEQTANVRKALEAEKLDDTASPIHFPQFVYAMKPRERLDLWDDVQTFKDSLPSDPLKQEYVLAWLETYSFHRRMDLYDFLVGDKRENGRDMSLPSDPRERAEFLEFLETWGGDTRQCRDKGTYTFSFWYHITDGRTMWAVHIVCLVIFALFTIGLYTRVTSVLAWAASLCYIHRGQLYLFGQDTMQTILITYLMIGPSGATLSIDALRKRYRAALALMGSGNRSAPWATAALAGPQPSWLANFAIRMFQINFCFIYLSSGFSKLKGSTWWQHEAAWLILANPEFGLIRYQAYDWFLRVLAESRFLTALYAAFVTLFTLATEIGLPFLIWTRLRPVMVTMSALLHFGIALMMGLTVFSLYMYALLLCYLPAKLIRDRVAWAPGSGRKMTVHYDNRDRAAVRKAALIRALDVAGQVTFVPATSAAEADHTVRLTDSDGRQVTGEDLYRTGLRELVLLRPVRFLGYIPGVWAAISAWFGR